jgi:ABC-type Mn2+/Zn2+ transport system permease subunit
MILATVAAGIGIGLTGEHLHQRDVAIGIVLALMLGLGLLFLHFFTAYATQVTALLFGNVLAVDVRTVWTLLAVGVVIVAALALDDRRATVVLIHAAIALGPIYPRPILPAHVGSVSWCVASVCRPRPTSDLPLAPCHPLRP